MPRADQPVSIDQARTEAAARAMRLEGVLAPLWQAARLWAAAVAFALFPLLFIVDARIETPLSPVLPGLILLAVLIVGMPFLLMEVLGRRYRRHDDLWQQRHGARNLQSARAAVGLAVVWLAVWFAVGT